MAFTDTFTEAVDTNLEDHTPSGGTDWALGAGAVGAAKVNALSDNLRSSSTTASYYTHDNQGSSNNYVQARLKTLSATFPDSYVATRLLDASNFVGWRCFGTGATGLRLCSVVAGVVTDLYSFQGVDEAVYRVEVSGTTAKIFENGVQQGGDQIVAVSTETKQGVRIGSSSTSAWIDDYEAGTLGGGATELNCTPIPFEWTVSSISLNENINTSPVNWEWTPLTGTLTENLNSIPVNWEWTTSTATFLGTDEVIANIIPWEWETTTGNLLFVLQQQESGTIGGKPDKKIKLPFYDSEREYISHVQVDEVIQVNEIELKVDKPAKKDKVVPISDKKNSKESANIAIAPLLGDLVQQVQIAPVELKEVEVFEEDESLIEDIVVSLLLAA